MAPHRLVGEGRISQSPHRNPSRRSKPHRPPSKAGIFMEAGRLATEYLLFKGLIPSSSIPENWTVGHDRDPKHRSRDRESSMPRPERRARDDGHVRRRFEDEYDHKVWVNRGGDRREEDHCSRRRGVKWENRSRPRGREGPLMKKPRGYNYDNAEPEDGFSPEFRRRGWRGRSGDVARGCEDDFSPQFHRRGRRDRSGDATRGCKDDFSHGFRRRGWRGRSDDVAGVREGDLSPPFQRRGWRDRSGDVMGAREGDLSPRVCRRGWRDKSCDAAEAWEEDFSPQYRRRGWRDGSGNAADELLSRSGDSTGDSGSQREHEFSSFSRVLSSEAGEEVKSHASDGRMGGKRHDGVEDGQVSMYEYEMLKPGRSLKVSARPRIGPTSVERAESSSSNSNANQANSSHCQALDHSCVQSVEPVDKSINPQDESWREEDTFVQIDTEEEITRERASFQENEQSSLHNTREKESEGEITETFEQEKPAGHAAVPKVEEEKHPEAVSYKICDLNLIGTSEMSEIQGDPIANSLEISELLGGNISRCPSVQADLSNLQAGMSYHSTESFPGDDDPLYASLGELPTGYMGIWDQAPRDCEKLF